LISQIEILEGKKKRKVSIPVVVAIPTTIIVWRREHKDYPHLPIPLPLLSLSSHISPFSKSWSLRIIETPKTHGKIPHRPTNLLSTDRQDTINLIKVQPTHNNQYFAC